MAEVVVVADSSSEDEKKHVDADDPPAKENVSKLNGASRKRGSSAVVENDDSQERSNEGKDSKNEVQSRNLRKRTSKVSYVKKEIDDLIGSILRETYWIQPARTKCKHALWCFPAPLRKPEKNFVQVMDDSGFSNCARPLQMNGTRSQVPKSWACLSRCCVTGYSNLAIGCLRLFAIQWDRCAIRLGASIHFISYHREGSKASTSVVMVIQ